MNPFPSILVPLDGSITAAKSLGCATWLAERLQIRLHILSATERMLPVQAELRRLHVAEEHWPLVSLHQTPAYAGEAILSAIARHRARLVILSAKGQTSEDPTEETPPSKLVGSVARAVLEQSPVPVLLLPPAYRESLPWKRVLVPISGDPATNEALARTIPIANALDLTVHIVHVTNGNGSDHGLTSAARYADTLHHEYRGRLEGLVSRALPHCPQGEAGCIEDLALCRGDVASELLKLIDTRAISLVVVGWHGLLTPGHAPVLKHLLGAVTCPILLMRPAPRMPFTLKVGEALGEPEPT
jgi:nucleotide-binding universal stress UspA family protein